MQYDLLLKLLAAHFLSDFFLQMDKWVEQRNKKHFGAPALYVHGGITAATIIILCGFNLWFIALLIGLSHIIFDGTKSYLKQNSGWFIADQVVHLIILFLCWKIYTSNRIDMDKLTSWYGNPEVWLYISAVLFLIFPSGMLIAQITKRWREQLEALPDHNQGLARAGMLIGILERLIVFVLVISARYEIIGFLVAAKTLLRFNEANRPEAKTEYLLIGTLLSVGIAMGVGFLVTIISFN